MSTKVYVTVLPDCDIHKYDLRSPGVPAAYDGKTKGGSRPGSWANMCEACFAVYGVGLGTGKGQMLVVASPVEESATDRKARIGVELNAALEAGDFDAAQEAIGDGDISEWL